jgi:hypothetical protein
VAPNVATDVTLQVGHGPLRQRSPIPLRRITRYEAIAPNGGVINMRDDLRFGDDTKNAVFEFRARGAYILALETDDRAEVHLPAIRFNDYLNVEGLTPAIKERQRTHRLEADGSESYSRCAKSLVQVGPPNAALEEQITKPLGLSLEIIPQRNPYAEPRSATLPILILYEGLPLAGALVKLTNLEHDEVPFEMHTTNAEGQASFTMPAAGSWLLNVIWTKIQPQTSDTDFKTTFSSLSFGFPSDHE